MTDRIYRFDGPIIAPKTMAEQDAYRALFQLSESATYSVDDVLELVQPHPPIADRLLRVANSLRHASTNRTSDVRHAVVILGARGLREFSEPIIKSLHARSLRKSLANAAGKRITGHPPGRDERQ